MSESSSKDELPDKSGYKNLPNSQEMLDAANAELSSLGRVSHRLALTESGQALEKVLSLLLPRLLKRIGLNHQKTLTIKKLSHPSDSDSMLREIYDKVHLKLVEMLGHIMKRVRSDTKCHLPCNAILDLLYDSSTYMAHDPKDIDPFTLNLSLAFLTLGISRCATEEVDCILPGILAMVGAHSGINSLKSQARKNQSSQVRHLFLRALESSVTGKRQTNSSHKEKKNSNSGKKSLKSSEQLSISNDIPTTFDYIKTLRNICSSQLHIGAAVYDLLLDVLLYQPSSNSANGNISSLPPLGLSQNGYEMLCSGTSNTAKNWVAEFSSPSRLRDLKLAILVFIAPCRRWKLFLNERIQSQGGGGETQEKDVDDEAVVISELGIARTVALLAVASGDPHIDVADKATNFMKAHMDSRRNISNEIDRKENKAVDSFSPLLGNHVVLTCSLLSLVIGENVASASIEKAFSKSSIHLKYCLGCIFAFSSATLNENKRIILSTKRRMVSTKVSASIMYFVCTQIFDQISDIFKPPISSKFMDENDLSKNVENSFIIYGTSANCLGSLTLLAAKMFISNGGGSSMAANTSSRGSSRVAAARLLSSVCIRVSSLLGEVNQIIESKEINTETHYLANTSQVLTELFSYALDISCKELSTTSSHITAVNSRENLDLKDACYGIICTIARSEATKSDILYKSKISSTSNECVATASLLFQCIANESETLRPRAVAALDALLGAYCKKYCKNSSSNDFKLNDHPPSNPWMNYPSSKHESKIISKTVPLSITKALIPMLWNAAAHSKPKASRLAAAHWTNSLLKVLHVESGCHLLCFLAGDNDITVSNYSRENLGINNGFEDAKAIPNQKERIPEFNDLISTIFLRKNISSSQFSFYEFPQKSQGASLRFGLISLLDDLYGAEDESIILYTKSICDGLKPFKISSDCCNSSKLDNASMDFLDEASFCLASCLQASPLSRIQVLNSQMSINYEDISNLALSACSSKSRRFFSKAVGHLANDFAAWNCKGSQKTDIDFISWIDKSSIYGTLTKCVEKLEEIQTVLFMCNEAHGAAYLGSRLLRTFRLAFLNNCTHQQGGSTALSTKCLEKATQLINALSNGLLHSDDVISNACAAGLRIGFSFDSENSPILEEQLHSCTAYALLKISVAMRKFGNGDNTNVNRVLFVIRAAGTVLAASTSGAGSTSTGGDVAIGLGKARLQCVENLFFILGSSSYRKDNEISLVVGESLAEYADAYNLDAVWTTPSKPWTDQYDEVYAVDLPPHSQVLYRLLRNEIKYSSPHKRNASAPALLAIIGRATRTISNGSSPNKRPLVKEILNHLLECQDGFISLLSDKQSKQLARESSCLGLVACRGLSVVIDDNKNNHDKSHDLNNRLLKAFGHSKVYGTSALAETRDQQLERMSEEQIHVEASAVMDTTENIGIENGGNLEIGGASGIGEAALGAYREMSSAAIALGRPDILYSLMVLSVTHPAWSNATFSGRYNASTLLGKTSIVCGSNISEIRNVMKPHLANLIPRLLRACHDPNKQTREQMSSLWIGITGGGVESRNAVTENLLTTIDLLMEDTSNKSWRARAGACGALSEVIVGRTWKDLGGGDELASDDFAFNKIFKSEVTAATRLLLLLRTVTRSLDDTRLVVRENGGKLATSVRSLISHLCDPYSISQSNNQTYSSSSLKETKNEIIHNASKAAATSLGWLVNHGLSQACAEATGFCLSTLLRVVDVSMPSTLQPVIPKLIGSLAMAMSGLEPAALNYLQVRAAGDEMSSNQGQGGLTYDRLERVRLQLAQSGPIATALTKCLEMVKSIDISAQKAVITELDSALRCGAGFATRSSVADAVTVLSVSCPAAFKFSGNSSTNPTVRLLRALYFASERERGVGAKDKMAFALGNLAKLSPGSSVRSLTIRACERYVWSTGSNDDPSTRRAAAAAISAISVRASSQFSDGGSNDIWIRRVLPLAFLGKYDKDDKVASLWRNVWEEGGQVIMASRKNGSNFGVTLEESLLPFLVKSCIESLNDVSWSRRVAACAALIDLSGKNILAPVPRQLCSNAPTDDMLKRAQRRAQSSFDVLSVCVRILVKNRHWDGKADLVKAAVKIGCSWASVGSLDDEKQWVVFGCDPQAYQKGNKKFYVPISLHSNCPDDLFEGDRWFERNLEQQTDIEDDLLEDNTDERAGLTHLESSSTEDSSLNFDEVDKIALEEVISPASPCTEDSELNRNGHDIKSVTIAGFCRALVHQAIRHNKQTSIIHDNDSLLYRAACLQGAADIVKSLKSTQNLESTFLDKHKHAIYKGIVHDLTKIVHENTNTKGDTKVPALIAARCITCISATFWTNIGALSEPVPVDVSKTLQLFQINCGEKQPAWTVREAAGLGASELVHHICVEQLKKVKTVETLIDCSVQCLKDKKFWRVRLAGLHILQSLTNRVSGKSAIEGQTRQIILEALLPYKEQIIKLARQSLSDNESKVTAIGSVICGAISWWP